MSRFPSLPLLLITLLGHHAWAIDPPGEKTNWVELKNFSDEFSGEKVDSSKWFNRNPKWKGRRPVFFHPSCVAVRDGRLVLSAKASDESKQFNLRSGFTHVSGFISSKSLVRFGYFEVRAKLMDSSLVSCFWLSRHDREEWSEIDCVEMAAGIEKHKKVFRPNLHYFFGPHYRGNHKNHWASPSQTELDFDPTTDFHIYGVEWDNRHIRWYVDGRLIRESENKHHFQPLNLHINIESNHYFNALPDDQRLPAAYEVDWIRSYRRKADTISISAEK